MAHPARMNRNRAIQRLLRRLTNRRKSRNSPRKIEQPKQVRRLPPDHIAAAKSLVNHDVIKTPAYLKKVHKTDSVGSHPMMIEFYRKLIKELEKRGYPFYAFYFVRTHAEQDRLYAQGRTKARGGESPHNWGMAVDIVHATRFWDLTRREWAVIGAIGKEVARRMKLKVTWGGDWKFYDPAHWQLEDWRQLKTAIVRLDYQGKGRQEQESPLAYWVRVEEYAGVKIGGSHWSKDPRIIRLYSR